MSHQARHPAEDVPCLGRVLRLPWRAPQNRFLAKPDGELGLNDLYAGHLALFRHIDRLGLTPWGRLGHR